jgi:hypothetical protein
MLRMIAKFQIYKFVENIREGKGKKKEKKKIIPRTFHNQTKNIVSRKLEIQQPHINICDPPLFGGTLFKIKFERTLSIG